MKPLRQLCAFLAFLSLLLSATSAANLAARRPNIIFLITDDQGYGDISAHGNPVLKTPNLDRLRAEGVRFEDFMVSPTCSPTRSAIMSGRHEFKNGVTHTILERERMSLPTTTLAQVLKSAGYATGIFGKWHLGDEAEYRPDRRGFDETYIHGGGGIGQSYPGSCGDAPGNKYFDPAILHNGTFKKERGYCTDLFYAAGLRWMDERRRSAEPYFAYISTNAPHSPYIARPEDKKLYEGKNLGEDTENFFGMIHNIDENIGRLLAKLKEWDIDRNTLVVFVNDNGGTAGVQVFNAEMRGRKGSPWLGGTRAASFWRWPGTLTPAPVASLAAHIDVLPTLAEIAGAKLSAAVQQQVEGRSLVPLLQNPKAPWADRTLFTHLGRWPKGDHPNTGKYNMTAVRNTRWSLVNESRDNTAHWQLFDLSKDRSQQTDVSAQHPDVVRELSSAFERWWQECLPLMVNEKAVGPKLNPFAELYWKQFGGGPTAADYARMDPNQPFPPPAKKKKK